MATTYEQTTTVHSTKAEDDIRPDPDYVKTIPGILKIVEIVLDVLVLICASIDYWYHLGGGWVQFVAASALVTTLILFIFHFFRIIYRMPSYHVLIEFIYYCIYVLLYFIAAIVAATRAFLAPSIGAACFFTFAATAVYAVDTVFMYRSWKTIKTSQAASQTAATTTTTTTFETRTQY